MNDYAVRTVREGVELARDWQRAGTHTWFRGQTRPWPLVSSLARRQHAPAESARVTERIGLFCEWLRTIEELAYLLEPDRIHEFFAVLQHYGVPTHYVDFSADPAIAGFFAAHGSSAQSGETGCIIAVDPDDMVDLLRTAGEALQDPVEAWPEKVTVSVPDLWRMQVQSGSFLYLPKPGVEGIYGYDRILFEHTPEPYDILETDIYPPRKSALEARLDEFFAFELTRKNQVYLEQLFEKWRTDGKIHVHVIPPLEAQRASAYLQDGTEPNSSWSVDLRNWIELPGENYATHSAGASVR